MVERAVLLARYPESRRTWLKFRGGWWSGANMFYLRGRRVLPLLDFWGRIERDRKKGLKIIAAFGPWLLIGALLRLFTIQQGVARAGLRFGLKATVVPMSEAEACIDADKPSDIELIERIFAARRPSRYRAETMTIEKAIILSAGQGSRLLPLTRDIPKCLIDLNGRTLIGWQVAALAANGIKDIVVVTGFRTERVEDHALQLYRDTGVRIRTLFNPFFQVADNLGTCWIAREEMDRDFIILNGDTIISDEIVAKLIAGANEPITVTVDVKSDYDDDDMKVNRDSEGRLHHIGKRLLPPDTNAESIGMLAFVGDGPSIFRNQVDQMMRTPEGVERWYLRAIDVIAKGNRVGTVSIEGLEWQEVDFPQDVEAADALTARWAAAGLYAK